MLQTVVITSICGQGLSLAKYFLSQKGCTVILGVHSEKSRQIAQKSLNVPTASKLFILDVDFSSFAGSDYFVGEIYKTVSHMDVLINTAGVFWKDGKTANGYDARYGVNFLGTTYMCLHTLSLLHAGEGVVVNFAPKLYAEHLPEIDLEFLCTNTNRMSLERKYQFNDLIKSNLMVGKMQVLFIYKLLQKAKEYGVHLRGIVADYTLEPNNKANLSLISRAMYQSYFAKECNTEAIIGHVQAYLGNKREGCMAKQVTEVPQALNYLHHERERDTHEMAFVWESALEDLQLKESALFHFLNERAPRYRGK